VDQPARDVIGAQGWRIGKVRSATCQLSVRGRLTSISEARGAKTNGILNQYSGRIATLRIVGELDAITTPTLRPSVDPCSLNGKFRVVVDVSVFAAHRQSGVGGLVFYKKPRSTAAW